MKLKHISIILAACALLPVPAFADDENIEYPKPGQLTGDFQYENVWYDVIDEEAKICRTASVKDFENYELATVTIDENWVHEVTLLHNTKTDDYWFAPNRNCQNDIRIPETVIGNGIEYTVTEIGDYSFVSSNNLSIREFSDKIVKIGKSAFEGSGVKFIVFGNNSSLKSIEDSAFKNTPDFSGVEQGNNNFVLPASLSEIGTSAFEGSKLQYVVLPENLNTIGEYAFYNCRSLEGGKGENNNIALTIPGSVTTISNYAFGQCVQLKGLNLEYGIQYIGDYAFEAPFREDENGEVVYTSSPLPNIFIPSSIIRIGKGAFKKQDLATIVFEDTEEHPSQLQIIDDEAFWFSQALKELVIPNTVVELGHGAFYFCNNLADLTIGESVEFIGNQAFYSCQSIKCIYIPDSVKIIGDEAFWYAGSVGSCFYLGNSLEWIGDRTFYTLDTIVTTLPASLKHIGDEAFNLQAKHNTGEGSTENTLDDMYIYATYPPSIFEETFGMIDEENFAKGHWIYLTVCLHVPQGSLKWYKNYYILDENGEEIKGADNKPIHNPWSNFQCIIDDVVNTGGQSLSAILTYVFTTPGETTYLSEIVPTADGEHWTWDYLANSSKHTGTKDDDKKDGDSENEQTEQNDIAENAPQPGFIEDTDCPETDHINHIVGFGYDEQKGAFVHANHFGQEIMIAYRDDDNQKLPNGEEGDALAVEHTYAAAVIVFVCPTVTMVYDTENQKTEAAKAKARKANDGVDGEGTEGGDGTGTSTSDKEDETNDYVTYEHRVVYNSLPKLNISTSDAITVTAIQRGSFDEDGASTNEVNENLTDIETNQYIDDNGNVVNNLNKDANIVPIDPIQDDRVVKISADVAPINYQGDLSGATDVEITDQITVAVKGNTVTVLGADADDIVKVYDTNGQLVYSSTTKSFQIFKSGVYIATVADAAFKIAVR